MSTTAKAPGNTGAARVRISIASSHRIVDAKDARNVITSPEPTLFGTMLEPQQGEVAYVTLDDGRDALVMRRHLVMEVPGDG